MNNGYNNKEVSFEIVEQICVLSTHSSGWSRELNLVRWNGNQPKYDIRDWSPGHERMSKGITLKESDLRMMFDALNRKSRSNKPSDNQQEQMWENHGDEIEEHGIDKMVVNTASQAVAETEDGFEA